MTASDGVRHIPSLDEDPADPWLTIGGTFRALTQAGLALSSPEQVQRLVSHGRLTCELVMLPTWSYPKRVIKRSVVQSYVEQHKGAEVTT